MTEESSDWHLNKSVTLTIIFSIISLCASLVGIYVAMKEDVATIKAQIAEMRVADNRQEKQVAEAVSQFREDVKSMRAELSAEIRALSLAIIDRERRSAK